MPCVYLPGPTPTVTVANNHEYMYIVGNVILVRSIYHYMSVLSFFVMFLLLFSTLFLFLLNSGMHGHCISLDLGHFYFYFLSNVGAHNT